MVIVGLAFGVMGLVFLVIAVLLFGRFRNINRRLRSRFGREPNLLEKWRGDYPSNASWRGLVIEISSALIIGVIGIVLAVLFIFALDTQPDGARNTDALDRTATERF